MFKLHIKGVIPEIGIQVIMEVHPPDSFSSSCFIGNQLGNYLAKSLLPF